jgi:hypothetical protein
MSGAIMPEPLMIAPGHGGFADHRLRGCALGEGVGRADGVRGLFPGAGLGRSAASIPARALSLGSGTPITPVEDTKTCSRGQPRWAAT